MHIQTLVSMAPPKAVIQDNFRTHGHRYLVLHIPARRFPSSSHLHDTRWVNTNSGSGRHGAGQEGAVGLKISPETKSHRTASRAARAEIDRDRRSSRSHDFESPLRRKRKSPHNVATQAGGPRVSLDEQVKRSSCNRVLLYPDRTGSLAATPA